jgi:hypothetical protein
MMNGSMTPVAGSVYQVTYDSMGAFGKYPWPTLVFYFGPP